MALLALLLAQAPGAQAQTNRQIKKLQSQQNALKQQITESEKLLRSTKSDVRSQLNNLMLLNSRIDTQQRYMDGVQGQIDTLNGSISVLERQLAALQRDLGECKRKYQRSVVYLFRNKLTHNKLMFVFSAKNFRQMYRRMRYVTEYAKYQRAQGNIIKTKELAVRDKKAELLSAKAEKDRLLAQGRREQAKLETQKQERQGMVDELNKKQGQLQAQLNQTRKKYAALNNRIDQLIQQEIAAAERRRKEAEARARKEREAKARREREAREREARARRETARREADKKKATASRGTAGRGKSTSGRAPSAEKPAPATATPSFRPADNVDRRLSNDFAANRGRLPVPITGSYVISSRYGQYNVAGLKGVQLDNKGINITGKKGAQARCVFNGEVSAVFSFGGMFNVIVRHGSYISVYCNLASASVRQGQKVTTRQTLGSIAPDASGNCTLHFQLRKETSKLNPEQWIAR